MSSASADVVHLASSCPQMGPLTNSLAMFVISSSSVDTIYRFIYFDFNALLCSQSASSIFIIVFSWYPFDPPLARLLQYPHHSIIFPLIFGAFPFLALLPIPHIRNLNRSRQLSIGFLRPT